MANNTNSKIFMIGDVVHQSNDDTLMVVSGVCHMIDINEKYQTAEMKTIVHCVWFNGMTLYKKSFDASLLNYHKL